LTRTSVAFVAFVYSILTPGHRNSFAKYLARYGTIINAWFIMWQPTMGGDNRRQDDRATKATKATMATGDKATKRKCDTAVCS